MAHLTQFTLEISCCGWRWTEDNVGKLSVKWSTLGPQQFVKGYHTM